MKRFRNLPLLALLIGMFGMLGTSCIYIDDNGPGPILQTGDLEVRVSTPSGFAVRGAEVTLYYSYQDANQHRYPVATGYTDPYGVTVFRDLPVGETFYVRAQGSGVYSLGSVFLEFSGLWVLPMELI
jgi:hypothetical protein